MKKVTKPHLPAFDLKPPTQREKERFLRAMQEDLSELANQPLSILVWGPGTSQTSPAARKRVQIRDELLKLDHNAMFSEELEQFGQGKVLKLQELAQARNAHQVIILWEDAPGAMGEAHDFANLPNIAWKFYILIPKRYEKGYSSQGALLFLKHLWNSVYWYEEGELESCSVLGKVLERTDVLRQFFACSGAAAL
jgi:hypothetical protein